MSINTAPARGLCIKALIVNILCVQWIPNNCQLRSWERLLFRPLSYISTLPARPSCWYIEEYIVTLWAYSAVLLIYLGIKSVMNLSVAPWPLTHFSLLPIKARAKLLVKCLSIQSICILPPTNFKTSILCSKKILAKLLRFFLNWQFAQNFTFLLGLCQIEKAFVWQKITFHTPKKKGLWDSQARARGEQQMTSYKILLIWF